ncbi:MAG: class I SAM-dependent methyltransferase [Ginsengibacter sp.]
MADSRFIKTAQVENFCEHLSDININLLDLPEYQHSYLTRLLDHKKYFITIYAAILNELMDSIEKQKEDIFLVDYGAGTGLLGLFAKFCGFGKIVQVDISSACCLCQQILSQKLNLPVFENITGDVEELKKFLPNSPDALVASDVIEHIYDLDLFFSTIKGINKDLVTVFTTASNDKNWWKKKRLMKVQRIDEWKGSESEPSFRTVRGNIIKKEIPQITYSELRLLITRTRGLDKKDILLVCEKYKMDGSIPSLINHPTNTCDPISGSWTERILSYNEYYKLFNKHHFSLTIKNGFYNEFRSGPKGIISKVLNQLIKLTDKKGNYLSPFIFLIGK